MNPFPNSPSNEFWFGNYYTSYGSGAPLTQPGYQQALEGMYELYQLYNSPEGQQIVDAVKSGYNYVFPEKPHVGPVRVLPSGLLPGKSYSKRVKEFFGDGKRPHERVVAARAEKDFLGPFGDYKGNPGKDSAGKQDADDTLVELPDGQQMSMRPISFAASYGDLVDEPMSNVKIGSDTVTANTVSNLALIGKRPIMGEDGENAVMTRKRNGKYVWRVGYLEYPVLYMGRVPVPFSFSGGRYQNIKPKVNVFV